MPFLQRHLARIAPLAFAATALALPLAKAAAAPAGSEPPAAEPRESRRLSFRYEVRVEDVPATARPAYLWVPIPPTDLDQTTHRIRVDSAVPHLELREPKYGNRAMRFELRSGVAEQSVALEFDMTRFGGASRSGAAPAPLADSAAHDPRLWLGPDRLIPIDGLVRELALRITAPHPRPAAKARAIYDYVVREMDYDKSGSGWGNGDAIWACDARRGNCTDFHSLFIGCARAVGIPARFEMGVPIPLDREAGEIAGYHCWAQVHLEDRGWIPIDASEAHKNPHKHEFFFGGSSEDRILLTVGRDLLFEGMQCAPLNFFIDPHVEVSGEKWSKVSRRCTYRGIDSNRS